jgi:hypothetical protein
MIGKGRKQREREIDRSGRGDVRSKERTMSPRPRTRTASLLAAGLGLVVALVFGTAACKPGSSPQNWRYNSVRQAHSTATFGVHHDVDYRYNGKRIEVLKHKCAADNWYSGLRYVGSCTAVARNGRLEVRWEWNWVKGSPPIARTQSYSCGFDVSRTGKITREKPGLMSLPCNQFES